MLNLSWLDRCDRIALQCILRDYGFLIHRFAQYIALVVGHCDELRARQLLLDNLLAEVGSASEPAHYELYRELAKSCGVDLSWSDVDSDVKQIEAWFYSVYDGEDTIRALAVLGPGTEEIAQSFLEPLESAVATQFPDADKRYFEAHRPDREQAHIADIRRALAGLITDLPPWAREDTERAVESYSSEALDKYATFWRAQRKYAPSLSSTGSTETAE
jgi:pyrroloquinoline quinone (PQQ) biosynthesis protein C